jgi:hypothetical protein
MAGGIGQDLQANVGGGVGQRKERLEMKGAGLRR